MSAWVARAYFYVRIRYKEVLHLPLARSGSSFFFGGLRPRFFRPGSTFEVLFPECLEALVDLNEPVGNPDRGLIERRNYADGELIVKPIRSGRNAPVCFVL